MQSVSNEDGRDRDQEQRDEEAHEEPEIMSPEEMAERTHRAIDLSSARAEAGDDPDLEEPKNPLRMPGGLSRRRGSPEG